MLHASSTRTAVDMGDFAGTVVSSTSSKWMILDKCITTEESEEEEDTYVEKKIA